MQQSLSNQDTVLFSLVTDASIYRAGSESAYILMLSRVLGVALYCFWMIATRTLSRALYESLVQIASILEDF